MPRIPQPRQPAPDLVPSGMVATLDRPPVEAPSEELPTEPRPGGPGPGGSGPGGSGGWGGWWGDDSSFPQSPHVRRWRRVSSVLVATVLVFAAGLGIGYAAYRPTASSTAPQTSPAAAGVAARVDPALVDVDATLAYETVRSAGTGMVVTPSGEVVTNNHVIDGATSVHVTDVGNGQTYPATVVGYDTAEDVAVLRIEGASGLPTVATAGTPAAVGQPVVAVGNAGGVGGTPSAAAGTVTGLGRSITAGSELSGRVEHLSGLVATDAPIQSGDSGGPLVDRSGHVLGMDTAGTGSFSGNGEGYAIPAGTFMPVASAIVAGDSSATVHVGPTAFLGVRLSTAGTAGGIAVVQAEPGSPAAAAGLVPGDVLTSVGGHAVTTPTGLTAVLQGYRPGDTVGIAWKDAAGVAHTGSVTLASGPPA